MSCHKSYITTPIYYVNDVGTSTQPIMEIKQNGKKVR